MFREMHLVESFLEQLKYKTLHCDTINMIYCECGSSGWWTEWVRSNLYTNSEQTSLRQKKILCKYKVCFPNSYQYSKMQEFCQKSISTLQALLKSHLHILQVTSATFICECFRLIQYLYLLKICKLSMW